MRIRIMSFGGGWPRANPSELNSNRTLILELKLFPCAGYNTIVLCGGTPSGPVHRAMRALRVR